MKTIIKKFKAMSLRLFDTNTNVTTDPGLSNEMKTFYSNYLINLAEPELVHDQFGQKHPIPKNGGKIITSHVFKGVKDGAVVMNSLASGFDIELEADACVIARGVKPNTALIDEFEAAFDKVAVAGDTLNPGNIPDATHSGYDKAFVF